METKPTQRSFIHVTIQYNTDLLIAPQVYCINEAQGSETLRRLPKATQQKGKHSTHSNMSVRPLLLCAGYQDAVTCAVVFLSNIAVRRECELSKLLMYSCHRVLLIGSTGIKRDGQKGG